jgi:hypothetical protein
MAQVFRSGAFLQQCWSVHPLCLAVKRLADERTLILSCSSCRSVHHLALVSVEERALFDQAASPDGASKREQSRLVDCLAAHASALSLRKMDVFEEMALLRCAECRRHYSLQVASFETHQK